MTAEHAAVFGAMSAALILSVSFACGGSQTADVLAAAAEGAPRLNLETTGEISGVVTLDGTPPSSAPIAMDAEPTMTSH